MTMSSIPDSSKHNPLSHFINSISSYDSNIMLAAVISLLLVILFVLLLHIYARWFMAQARHRRVRSSSVSVSHVLRPSRFHHFHAFNFDTTTTFSTSPSKGLDKSIISSIPLFVYKAAEYKQHCLECVICLSAFQENEVGRSLTKCGHGFHVECIDMWLHSHTNCPVCRAPAVSDIATDVKSLEGSAESTDIMLGDVVLRDGDQSRLEIVIDGSNSENENGNENLVVNCDSLSESTSSSSSSSLGCSLKRMLSRNRPETKVFPSRLVTELDA